ncbi:hypothetical protein L6452_27193 [Arctium lappa]|uniref:Uncharacterized protein n=1 Tax=Arctium lappa TaxID=4217 RepID=A0ACB8ZVS1_ARCLA|nr:hypothetical protein L6452_27193 [Arctium lappa]
MAEPKIPPSPIGVVIEIAREFMEPSSLIQNQMPEALATLASLYKDPPSPQEVPVEPLVQTAKLLVQAPEVIQDGVVVFRERSVGDELYPLIEEVDEDMDRLDENSEEETGEKDALEGTQQ